MHFFKHPQQFFFAYLHTYLLNKSLECPGHVVMNAIANSRGECNVGVNRIKRLIYIKP
jgi:hypothetical protein